MDLKPRPRMPELDPRKVGKKYDQGKLKWSLMPWSALEEVVKVLMHGAAKYGPENWKVVPEAHERYQNAAMRHLVAFLDGESNDSESGFSHLAHCVCCCLFLLWFKKGQK